MKCGAVGVAAGTAALSPPSQRRDHGVAQRLLFQSPKGRLIQQPRGALLQWKPPPAVSSEPHRFLQIEIEPDTRHDDAAAGASQFKLAVIALDPGLAHGDFWCVAGRRVVMVL